MDGQIEFQTITVTAPAKINLYLAVTGRRNDGYHDLDTLMVKVDLCDTLHLRVIDKGIKLLCPDSDVPDDESNLVYKAASAFKELTGITRGVEITLEKKIPIAAGLGGGSSDAAATLHGLQELFQKKIASNVLIPIGRTLGADVPFFLSDYDSARATGIGDRLEKRELCGEFWFVLVNPGFAVSTKWVYENFALTTGGNPYILGRKLESANGKNFFFPDLGTILYNDLEAVTVAKYPEIQVIKERLLAAGAKGVLMSGSGPTVFGVFEDERIAFDGVGQLRQRYNKVFLARPHLA
ncbi:MAG: 4-(cytidine 5'-diphospho)-2-C-methyl-D-erythritol kinase [Proteobacteria bacterium]|nr:4-(cytidine 5'-diphospho)-2-C-methyl-D-erythritol kinase [Pseudomonadota bacterium]MBU1708923.1 4-(cytidine 5'-diphospho)-2-C-methyl-D-erythritol kinase [Pseudomonadota bacterium]